jgi:hypothetical protein
LAWFRRTKLAPLIPAALAQRQREAVGTVGLGPRKLMRMARAVDPEAATEEAAEEPGGAGGQALM